ncbi:MAG: sugar ABC transporter ATP-binding protein, partial [Clostridia bacterium]
MEYILEMQGISKAFPGVKALDDVSFQLKRGEIHALIGENGAGKSTLMKVLMGIYCPDAGGILLRGKPFQAENPKNAQENGISMIYQEFNLIPDLTVAENIFVAREPRKYANLVIDEKRMIQRTQLLLDELHLDINASRTVSSLSVAEKQMVEIAKALVIHADILVLDEPTSALAENEVQRLFSIIRKLSDEGVAIIYISHRLEEFDQIVDRVTILRDGKYIATRDWSDITIQEMISMMVGRSITEQYPQRNATIGNTVLEAKCFTNKRLKNVSISVRSGEVLGMAGMMGAGRTEFAR